MLVVAAGNKVERRPVHVSGIVAEGVTIDDGLAGENSVIATAGAFLKEGEVVRPVPREPAGAAAGGPAPAVAKQGAS